MVPPMEPHFADLDQVYYGCIHSARVQVQYAPRRTARKKYASWCPKKDTPRHRYTSTMTSTKLRSENRPKPVLCTLPRSNDRVRARGWPKPRAGGWGLGRGTPLKNARIRGKRRTRNSRKA